MPKNTIQSYRKTQLNTSSPSQKVVLLYEAICKEIKKARHCMLKQDQTPKDIETGHNAIQLAEQIILELNLALDMEKGGDISKSLRGLYEFWCVHLSDANIKKDVKKLNEVLSMAEELRDTWKEAGKQARQQGLE